MSLSKELLRYQEPASQYNVTKHMHSNKRRKLVSTGIVTAVLNVALLTVTTGAV